MKNLMEMLSSMKDKTIEALVLKTSVAVKGDRGSSPWARGWRGGGVSEALLSGAFFFYMLKVSTFSIFLLLKRSLGERTAYAGTTQEPTGRLEFFAAENEIKLILGKTQN